MMLPRSLVGRVAPSRLTAMRPGQPASRWTQRDATTAAAHIPLMQQAQPSPSAPPSGVAGRFVRLSASEMPISAGAAELYSRTLEDPRQWLSANEMARVDALPAVPERATFYASRKAAKMALAQAADWEPPVEWTEIELARQDRGGIGGGSTDEDAHAVDPRIRVVALTDGMRGRLQGKVPFVSLSHDGDAAVGFACVQSDSPPASAAAGEPSSFELPSILQLPVRGRVFGVGVDVAEIKRLGEVHARSGERFLQKALSPDELQSAQQLQSSGGDMSGFLARRWSLKEALVKASGHRLLFPCLHLDDWDQLHLGGSARELFERERLTAHFSLERRGQMMYAFVVLEQRQEEK